MGIVIGLLAGRQTNTNMPINVSYHVSNICLYVGNDFFSSYMGMANAEKAKENSN